MNNIKSFLKNKSIQFLDTRDSQNNRDNISVNPAILFTSKSQNGLGNVYIFEHFGVTQANTLKMSSQITTHYMENNVARQDHWAIVPIQYTLSGLIGEVIFTPPTMFSGFVQKQVTDYLAPLGVISPTFDNYTKSAINVVQAVEASLRRYEQILVNVLNDVTHYRNSAVRKTNQLFLAEKLRELRDNRQLVDVWTPYGQFNGMAMQDVSLTQNNSKYQSNLEVQFIEWRDVETRERRATKEETSLVTRTIKQKEEVLGNVSQQKVNRSIWRQGQLDGKSFREMVYE